jgi:hypothetical protein
VRHDAAVLFADLAATSLAVGATRSRKRKAELLGEALRALDPGEVEPAVAYLSGELGGRRCRISRRRPTSPPSKLRMSTWRSNVSLSCRAPAPRRHDATRSPTSSLARPPTSTRSCAG